MAGSADRTTQRYMRIAVALAESEAAGCYGNAARSWSDGINILYDRGGMRRVHLRGRENILKRLVVHSGAANLGLLMRKLFGKGTPRASQGLRHILFSFPGASLRFFCATASLVSRLGSLVDLSALEMVPKGPCARW